MSSVSGLAAGLPLVVACDGSVYNAGGLYSISAATSAAVANTPNTFYNEAGVFIAAIGSFPVRLTSGENLADAEIEQVARVLTLRLCGKNADGSPRANCYPIYVSEIVDEVRGLHVGAKQNGPDLELLRHTVGELVSAVEAFQHDSSATNLWRLSEAKGKALGLFAPELDGETTSGEGGENGNR